MSEGTARTPKRLPSLPARCTDKPFGGPKARFGSWQEAQATLPDADSAGSKNSRRPAAASAAAEGLVEKLLA
jgi:hypothetical protein